MKTRFILYFAAMLLDPALRAQSLQDFGHGAWATGSTRSLLVVLANFATADPLGHDLAYFDDFVFNAQRRPSVNGYFQEVSNGRFTWRRAGAIGPINFTAGELGANFTPDGMEFGLRRQLYHSNMVHRIMTSGLFNFATADANQNGTVTTDELVIVVVSTDHWENTSNRGTGRVHPPGSSVAWDGSIVRLEPNNDFASVCHEIMHSLGAGDLYGGQCLSIRLTLMSCTITSPENPAIYHLDPWHKMLFGWSEPRLRQLRTGGKETIAAAQLGQPTAPLLLFNSSMGASDYFLVEYRTRTTPSGSGYDANVAGNGMVVWHFVSTQPLVAEGSPSLNRGGTTPWPGNATTPYLTNGTTTATRLFVRPFNIGDASITVEWLTESETWVDFVRPFFRPEFGTFDNPFDTVAEGQTFASHGGTLWIKAGSSRETPLLTKRMTVQAYDGPVTIGR